MNNPYQQKGAPTQALRVATATSTATTSSRDLKGILDKLRPFQREAFDFATTGKTSERLWANSDTQTDVKVKKKQHAKARKSKSDTDTFQYDETLLGKGRILLADEMGLGKTVTSLAIMAAYMNEWPLLILCPASLKHTWPSEIEKFLPAIPPSAVYVVSGFDDADFYANENKRKRIKIVVATYSLLQTRSASARVLDQFNFQCVIADESHNLKERNSQRCKLGMPLLQKAKRLVLLSGTPALARPVELWAQVNCIAPKLFGSYTAYTKEHCNARRGRFGWDVSGISNPDVLHQKLRQIMVRRLKSNVLRELPAKQRSIVPIKIDSDRVKECRDLMEELTQTRLSVDELVGEQARDAHFEARRLLMAGYQASGIGKARAVTDFLLDWLSGSGTQKILVFAHHKEVMDTLEQALAKKYKGAGHIRIDGSVPSKDRAVRVKKFQTNSRVRVGLLSMTAAGVGLTLTAASSVIFAELHWTPGVLAQAEDRVHRIGQQNAVNVMYCVCKDPDLSVDMRLWKMLGSKVGNLGRIIDGCKGASLNATVADPTEMKTGQSGESAADELVRFFAESSTNERNQARPQVPVKGSIMSFFKPSTSATSTNKSPIGTTGCHLQNDPAATSMGSTNAVQKQLPSKATLTWSCGACTFENMHSTTSKALFCKMCETPYLEENSIETSTVSPRADSAQPTQKQPDELIIIDSDSEDFGTKGNKSFEIVLVDVDVESRSVVTPSARKKTKREGLTTPKAETKECLLHFSVSRNSGRVLLHSATNGTSLCFSFDIDKVLTEECSDSLLESATSRKTAATPVEIRFNDVLVLSAIRSVWFSAETEQQCCEELKAFVRSYLSLRQVEKEALKQSDEPISPFAVRQTVAQIMTSTVSQKSTERYAGGAKETAQKNLTEGIATATDKLVLEGKACAWCAEKFQLTSLAKGVEATYCSTSCAEQGRLGRGGMFASTRVRQQVFGLEGGKCQKCGIDAHALYLRICALHPAERLNALCNASWRLPTTGSALERLLQAPKEGDFWQADHIVAVAEGGGACGVDNLRTLCTPCHKIETDKLRSRLRLQNGSKKDDDLSGRKQMDIRSAFFGGSAATKHAKTTARKRPRSPETVDLLD